MTKKYNFLPAAQAYFEIRDELEEFSKLKQHAFVVFNNGFDVKHQLAPRLESWRALCEWNRNDDVKHSYGMVDINFSIVRSIFEDLAHGRIKKKQFCDDLDGVCNLIKNYEITLSESKATAYRKLISLYSSRATATQNLLGSIVKEPQVIDWFMDLLQS